MAKWIKCAERQPTQDGVYLVLCEDVTKGAFPTQYSAKYGWGWPGNGNPKYWCEPDPLPQEYCEDCKFKLDLTEEKKTCNGLVFKASVNEYITKRGFAKTIRLDKLKRKSCPGCELCGWMDEAVKHSIEYGCLIGFEDVKSGELYTVLVKNVSYNRESGEVDDWELAIVPFESE